MNAIRLRRHPALAYLSLSGSTALYACQVWLFTKTQELLTYGLLGFLWYAWLLWRGRLAGANTLRPAFWLPGLIAIGLGFVPPRLRLGGGFDPMIFLFSAVHFVATSLYLYVRPDVEIDRHEG